MITWHEHFFCPEGTDHPVDYEDERRRFDACQDESGIFVLDVENKKIVGYFKSQREAAREAKRLATCG